MEIGVGQQRQEPRALHRHRQLPLIARLGARDARRNDLAVLVDEVLEERDILVVDLLDAFRREAAELPATEQLPASAARVLAAALALPLALVLAPTPAEP